MSQQIQRDASSFHHGLTHVPNKQMTVIKCFYLRFY